MLGHPGRGREASLVAGSGQERGERGGGEAGRTKLGRACRPRKKCESHSRWNERAL